MPPCTAAAAAGSPRAPRCTQAPCGALDGARQTARAGWRGLLGLGRRRLAAARSQASHDNKAWGLGLRLSGWGSCPCSYCVSPLAKLRAAKVPTAGAATRRPRLLAAERASVASIVDEGYRIVEQRQNAPGGVSFGHNAGRKEVATESGLFLLPGRLPLHIPRVGGAPAAASITWIYRKTTP